MDKMVESEKIVSVNNKTVEANQESSTVEERLERLEQFAKDSTEKIKKLEEDVEKANRETEYAIDKIYETRDSALFGKTL